MIKRLFVIFLTILLCTLRYRGPRHVRMIFQNLGGAFVKIGQMLALRSDIVSEPLAFELLELLEHTTPIPTSSIRSIIERELGNSIEQLFARFDDLPLATASFAQVHRATLHDGQAVVIKVQKPGVAEQVKQDLSILRVGSILIDALVSPHPVSARSVVDAFSLWTLKELDYRQEAEHIGRFERENDAPWIKVPHVVAAYTTSSVLTEEYLEGARMSELVQGPVVRQHRATAQHLLHSMVHQYFHMGYFHADPHPGNILLHANGALQYIDFGIMGTIDTHHRMAMAQFIAHVFNARGEDAVEAFLKLGFLKRLHKDMRYFLADAPFSLLIEKNLPLFKTIVVKELEHIMEPWLKAVGTPQASFLAKSSATSFLKFLAVAKRYRIHLDNEITLFVKALVAIDAICLQLDPEFDLVSTMKGIFGQEHYAWLFDEYIPENESFSPVPFSEVLDRERIAKLREYYTDWFEEIIALHPKHFNFYHL